MIQNLLIIGLGLLGGSVAKAARRSHPHLRIEAVDLNPAVLQKAEAEGVIDAGHAMLPVNIPENTLVVLAAHISGCLETLEILAPMVKGRSVLVTDISSCKRVICEAGERLLPNQFIGGHPMAGREISGYDAALATLFDGKLFILCPPEKLQNSQQLAAIQQFVQGLGMATKIMHPAAHDRVVAHVSHFPQLYALLITNLLHDTQNGEDMLQCHGGALADQLRLAASPHAMWGEVFKYNRDNLQEVLESFAGLLVKATSKLDNDAAMKQWFGQANDVHKTFSEARKRMAYDPFQTSTEAKSEA